jgi:hypothetical protein
MGMKAKGLCFSPDRACEVREVVVYRIRPLLQKAFWAKALSEIYANNPNLKGQQII